MQIRLDDWARAFAARLIWFGVREGDAELALLGRAMYEHYGLLDPYDIARLVWRRWPQDRGVAVRRRIVP